MYIVKWTLWDPAYEDPGISNTRNWNNYARDRLEFVKKLLRLNEYQGSTTEITNWLMEFISSGNHTSTMEVMRELGKRDIYMGLSLY